MGDSWFERQRQATHHRGGDAPVAGGGDETAQFPAITDGSGGEDVSHAEFAGGTSRPRRGVKSAPVVSVVVACVTLLVIAASAVAYVVVHSGSADVSPAPVVASPDSSVGVAGQCEAKDTETTVEATDSSLRGVVARWEDAYYRRDVGLTQFLTPSSWLRDQDWAAVLPTAAPDGSKWCAVMSPVDGTSVDVDVMVEFADGSHQTYQQRVLGSQDAGGVWLIDDIQTR